jgi:hypothetical protein
LAGVPAEGSTGAVGGVPSAATREPPPDGRLRARPGVARRMSWRTGSGSGGGRQSQQSSLRIDPPRTARTHLHSHTTVSHKSVSVGPRGLRDTRPSSSAERAAATNFFSHHLRGVRAARPLTGSMDTISLAACALAFALYYNTLDAGFVYDDRYVSISNFLPRHA